MIWGILFNVAPLLRLVLGIFSALFGAVAFYGLVYALAGVRRLLFVSLDL